jgi:hypothetical protein
MECSMERFPIKVCGEGDDITASEELAHLLVKSCEPNSRIINLLRIINPLGLPVACWSKTRTDLSSATVMLMED